MGPSDTVRAVADVVSSDGMWTALSADAGVRKPKVQESKTSAMNVGVDLSGHAATPTKQAST